MYFAVDDTIAMAQICNPNNPTGSIVSPQKLKMFCEKASKSTMVLVDEAYNEVTDDPEGNSMVPLVKAGHNVVVARTFSKIYGMAGMRVGYMIAAPANRRTYLRLWYGQLRIKSGRYRWRGSKL